MSKEKHRPRATYADLEALPDRMVGEILDGELFATPPLAPIWGLAASGVSAIIGRAYSLGIDGPGGWCILGKPELHLGPDPDVVVPDITGWRVARMPRLPDTDYFPLAPDWVCEVLSPVTEGRDRGLKLSIYRREGVAHVWLLNPHKEVRTLEVLRLTANGYLLVAVHTSPTVVRVEPFGEVELDLGLVFDTGPEDGAAKERGEGKPDASEPS